MWRRSTIASAACFGAWVGSGLAPAAATPAEEIRFGFSGTLETVSDPLDAFGGALAPGMPFDGEFRFDSEAPDHDAREGFGLYLFGSDPFTMRVDVGSLRFETNADAPALEIDIDDDFLFQGEPADRYVVFSDRFGPVSLSVQLLDLDGTAVDGDALLLDPPELEPFEFRVFELLDLSFAATLLGEVTELRRLPEPGPGAASAALGLLLGALRISALRRRSPRGWSGRRRCAPLPVATPGAQR